jgi:predicted enzyme related to lactoylglutathione lyase
LSSNLTAQAAVEPWNRGLVEMTTMIHSMIRALDEQRSVEFYRSVFGLEAAHRFEFDGSI